MAQNDLDILNDALKTVNMYYGIKQAKQALDLTERMQDFTSPVSRLKQGNQVAINDLLQERKLLTPEISSANKQNLRNVSAKELEGVAAPSQLLAFIATGQRPQSANQRQQNSVHEQVIKDLRLDPVVATNLVNFNKIDNALAQISSGQVTPAQMHEFQQIVRSASGVPGGGTADERSKTFINTAGYNWENIKQFLTGDMADLDKMGPIPEHFRKLARTEQQLARDRLSERWDLITSGHGWVYKDRPDLFKDLLNAVSKNRKQMTSKVPELKAERKPKPSPRGNQGWQEGKFYQWDGFNYIEANPPQGD